MNRRTFFKIAGMGSISIAAAGCSPDPEKFLYSLVHAPDDMVSGQGEWYASTCRECPAGCGIISKNREGRVIKLEGNPIHPINRGKLCMRGQAALQKVYNPDRLKTPLIKEKNTWRSISYPQALEILKGKALQAARHGQNRIRMLTEIAGETLLDLFKSSLNLWKSEGPIVFEPFAYESLRASNALVFGIEGLPSYRLEKADFLLCFGADFLETWLSPVEYSRKFDAMHSLKSGTKNLFIHVSPCQSLTAANADLWLSCRPGTEATVAFGLLREVFQQGRGRSLDDSTRTSIVQAVSPYTKERVLEESGLLPEQFEILKNRLLAARSPLILGTGTGSPGGNALQTNTGVNLLNLVLDPDLTRIDFTRRHRVELAARRSEVLDFFRTLSDDPVELLLLNNTNPVYHVPQSSEIRSALGSDTVFVAVFSNFMDETTQLANLVLPVRLPLETWDEYSGKSGLFSTLQPAMGRLTEAPSIGDVFLNMVSENTESSKNFKTHLISRVLSDQTIRDEKTWVQAISNGGIFFSETDTRTPQVKIHSKKIESGITSVKNNASAGLVFVAAPSIRFFDGRSANLPWLCEVPDPITKIAWQTPVLMNPKTRRDQGLKQGDVVKIQSKWGMLEAPVYDTEGVIPGVLTMSIGQGHGAYGRYAEQTGLNPLPLLSPELEPDFGGLRFSVDSVSVQKTGRSMKLAHTDGSRTQHNRKIAMSVMLNELMQRKSHANEGLTMHDFPLTLPLPEGYDPKRDFYPPHEHADYRWAMVVDLDKCIGCSACAVACYAENNIGVVGVDRIIEGREMSWLRVERYHDPEQKERITFLPMMCQHCDNAPCESVCPVYAPHHSKEGLNNQIYNRCIGTRFCAQNCPYKVRRFNWFTWEWPEPLNLQLNPNVTVRSKGVMEKCSFCIQRIKAAHSLAKNENRMIRDGEVIPACAQTCPTSAIFFGNLMDRESRVRKQVDDPRAYQVMGYLNAKPAVIYLKKVIHEI